jgi:hypothetical protein
MTKILYANGDSFVFGMECIPNQPCHEDSKMLAFPKYLGDKLGATTYINNAYNGATNDFIFKNTIIDLKKLEQQGYDPQDIFVVIGITSLHRTEIDAIGWTGGGPELDNIIATMESNGFVGTPSAYKEFKTIFVNPNFSLNLKLDGKIYSLDDDVVDFCARFLWTDNVQLKSQEAKLIALNELLTLKGYKHIFVNTVYPFLETEILDPKCKNFYKLLDESFWGYGASNFPTEHLQYNHFSTIPHKAYADILYEYIQKNLL